MSPVTVSPVPVSSVSPSPVPVDLPISSENPRQDQAETESHNENDKAVENVSPKSEQPTPETVEQVSREPSGGNFLAESPVDSQNNELNSPQKEGELIII